MAKTFKSVLGILLIAFVLLVVVAPVASCVVATPGARKKAQQIKCIHNLRMLDKAKMQLVEETGPFMEDVVSEADVFKFASDRELKCPAGGRYALGGIDDAPTCSMPGHALKR